ncbi:hypothetical protein M1247_32160 [Mycobacterium sp. 21AC1]|uniref:hypothetical protein n=1 Tax=[Mycobacterium] appelbergii TaxID=2939269 RepID=UPI0029393A19|nr:hypothetical protein [Mycobacterium sp. 21AC1]MDV3129598.1 hypothetical protein [Mycobacterium sp. 21AC1]
MTTIELPDKPCWLHAVAINTPEGGRLAVRRSIHVKDDSPQYQPVLVYIEQNGLTLRERAVHRDTTMVGYRAEHLVYEVAA